MVQIAGVDLDVFTAGEGAPLLFLHSGQGFWPDHGFVGPLAQRRRLICPSHPGFGKSSLPDWIDSIDDVSYLYLELLDRLGIQSVDIVGCSIGGWIAAELATKAPERVKKLVLVGPVGVKVGPPDKLDVPDIFAMPQERMNKLLYHDPDKMKMDPAKLSDEQLAILMRNRETLALLTWEPYMHNPKLKQRLHRVQAPVLFVRGESDGLISPQYMDGYAKLLPKARSITIPAAGHAPHVENPQAFVAAIAPFLDG